MMAEKLPEDLLKAVTPEDASNYALTNGWLRVDGIRGQITVFRPPDDDSVVQVVVPQRVNTEDYAERMADVLRRFAAREHRSATQVLHEMLAVGADVLRFQLAGPKVQKGMVPFDDGLKLYDGARASIIAAACGAIDPRKHYPRARRAAEDFMKACRMGQTEYGSYVATISCPVGVMPERTREETPFGRQATELLLNTMSLMTHAIERHEEETLLVMQEEKAVVSANLCDAILEMQPEDEQTTLDVNCAWAKTVPSSGNKPDTVRFKHQYRESIKRVSDALRPPVQERPLQDYIGTIAALRSEPDIVRRQLGEVIIFISDAGKPIHVRVELSPTDYAVACIAHRDGRAVLVRGVLERGLRVARIEHPGEFRILPTDRQSGQ